MVGFDLSIGKILLHCQADRGAASPKGHNKCGLKTAAVDHVSQPEGIGKQSIGI